MARARPSQYPGAGDESGELAEIKVAVDAEASGCGMSAGEFAEGHGHGPRNEGGGDEAENGCGPGDFHGCAGAEEKAGADGASDGDHGHLSGGQLVAESFFVNGWRRGQCSTISKRHGNDQTQCGVESPRYREVSTVTDESAVSRGSESGRNSIP